MNDTKSPHDTARLRLLRDADRFILASRSIEEVAASTFPYIQQFIPYDRASIVLFDFEAGYATILATESNHPTQLPAGKHISLADFSNIAALQQGRPMIIKNLTADPHISPIDKVLLAEGVQSYVMLPLIWQEALIGCLNLGLAHSDLLFLSDVDTVREIAAQVAVAVQQTLLFEADHRRLLESEAIATISRALNETLDLEEVFQLIAESAWQIIPHAERTVIHLLDEQTQILQPITVTRAGEVARAGLMMRPGEGIAGHVVQEGKLINVTDTHTDMRFLAGGRSDHRSLMVAPIKSQESNIGTITVQSRAPHAFTVADERLLTILVTQAALAIKNARLFADEQRARHLAETLRAANMALTQTLDLDAVLETLLEYISRLIPYDSANVMLREAEEYVVISAWRGYQKRFKQPENLQDITFNVSTSAIKPLFTTQQSVIVADTHANPDWDTGVGASEVRCWLGVPLLASGEVIGLYSLNKAEPNFFTQEHRELAEAFAAQAAIAVQNALLYKAEREQFRRLQRSQAQLVQAEKMGALGRLVASIAHEINNPIQAIQGCLTLTTEELAEAAPDSETVNLYLGIVKSELHRVATIVSNMRDFYRPASAGMDLTEIHEVLESVLKLMSKQLQRSFVAVVPEWSAEVGMVEANPSHLRQVFLNLVLNAIDAMPQGGTLQVSTALVDMPAYHRMAGSAVRVQFRDSGVGMSAETVSRLFEPFFTTKEQGSGLGLSISYGIIETHHGEITVQSQEGVGTTFTLLVPLRQP